MDGHAIQANTQAMDITRLRQILATRFDEGELRTLAFDLGVDYDDLPGEGKADKARELVGYLQRRNRLPELIAIGRQLRPDMSWEEPAEAIGDEAQEAAPPGRFRAAEFVNREDELHLLRVERLRTSRSPYTLISAPAGYGKTCLLHRLIDTVEADEALRREWCIRYVDLGALAGDQVAYLAHAITGVSSPPPTPLEVEGGPADAAPPVTTDWVCDYVIQELSTPLPEGRCAVLLIFDAVERLNEEARRWLYALLHDLRTRTRPGYAEIIIVRVIIAGRNAELFWEGYEQAGPRPPAPQRISLCPLDAHAIRELLWIQAQATHIDLDDQTVIQIADEVQYLSGGHPTVIRGLVDDLASQSFAIGPPAAYFAQHRDRLVRTVLSPVAGALLESLDPKTQVAVQILSVFRRVNANTVQALVKAGLLPPETNEVDLLGDMQRAHLLAGPGIREPFYRDPLLRRIWALNMAHGSPESRAQYHRLNKIALELYQGWIHDLGQSLLDSPLKPTQRLLSVVEWLFHALQDEDIDENELRFRLQDHVRVLSTGSQPPLVVDLIVGEMEQDTEVHYLLRHRLGDDGVSIAGSWLQSAG